MIPTDDFMFDHRLSYMIILPDPSRSFQIFPDPWRQVDKSLCFSLPTAAEYWEWWLGKMRESQNWKMPLRKLRESEFLNSLHEDTCCIRIHLFRKCFFSIGQWLGLETCSCEAVSPNFVRSSKHELLPKAMHQIARSRPQAAITGIYQNMSM